jgi:hypothetical protein
VARLLILGGGCRGRRLAAGQVAAGHAVRITTRTEAGRAAIESIGAECWVGTPDRLATLHGALDGVTVAMWLLGRATGSPEELGALHGSRLRLFLTQMIDTTVRGFVYEAPGASAQAAAPAASERAVRELTELNAIPTVLLTADPEAVQAWLGQGRAAVASLLRGERYAEAESPESQSGFGKSDPSPEGRKLAGRSRKER